MPALWPLLWILVLLVLCRAFNPWQMFRRRVRTRKAQREHEDGQERVGISR